MSFTIHHGDALTVLRGMPEASVQCVVTSPPYYGLRDYGTGKWEGGVSGCAHTTTRRGHSEEEKQARSAGTSRDSIAGIDHCRKCGALRVDQQIGLERTPDEYVARLVDVFRDVRRVLRPDGVLWLNIGDSYSGGKTGRGDSDRNCVNGFTGGQKSKNELFAQRQVPEGLKPKDLIGIPWMLAFALRADGWWLRQDIIWSKPNPMPESVKDRCTKAHEYLFLLAKSERYYYDAAAIADRATHAGKNVTLGEKSLSKGQANGANVLASGNGRKTSVTVADLRNRRSVWVMSTCPTPEAHFATFPLDLAQDCILAGSKVDDVVLDPFAGAGTTGLACLKQGRQFVGIELNADYVGIAYQRARKHYPLLMEVTA